MAKKYVILLEDDLDGSEADETVRFHLDGRAFEIDLSTAHAEELRGILRPYILGGRKKGPRGASVR